MTQAASAPGEGRPVRVGGLELLYPIATQRHAQVFLARREGPSGTHCFVKLAHDDDRLAHSNRMMELEFERLSRLDCDLFIAPRGFFQVAGRNMMELPFEEGISLSEILGGLHRKQPGLAGPLGGVEMALAVQCRILDAMSSLIDEGRFAFLALATSGADHLLITRGGRLRFIGFADVLESGTHCISEVWSPCTAPELFVEGRPADRRADIFAAGVLLFQILTLRPIISDREPSPHLAYRLYRNLHPKLSDVVDSLSGLDPLVERALRWLPEERFSSPEAFKAAILALRPEMRDHAVPNFEELFHLGLRLRGRKAESASAGKNTVGAKLSSID